MNICHSIEGNNLILTADEAARAELKELREMRGEDGFWSKDEVDALEALLGNSELQWVNPADVDGDLTEAPMLGVFGADFPFVAASAGDKPPLPPGTLGVVQVGADKGTGYWSAIEKRWAFMDYQVRSFLDDLVENGRAVFVS